MQTYGDLDHCGWTTEEEEDYEPKGKEETSLDEDEVPLPQPGDMHVEFKKSSLPDRAKKPKIEFIPFRLLQENKQELCKKVLSLECRWERHLWDHKNPYYSCGARGREKSGSNR